MPLIKVAYDIKSNDVLVRGCLEQKNTMFRTRTD